MPKIWFWDTPAGSFTIRLVEDHWHIFFAEARLGGYLTPQQAVDDLIRRSAFWRSGGIDPHKLKVPPNISSWEPLDAPRQAASG